MAFLSTWGSVVLPLPWLWVPRGQAGVPCLCQAGLAARGLGCCKKKPDSPSGLGGGRGGANPGAEIQLNWRTNECAQAPCPTGFSLKDAGFHFPRGMQEDFRRENQAPVGPGFLCMHVCSCVCTHWCMCVQVCMCVRMCVQLHVAVPDFEPASSL